MRLQLQLATLAVAATVLCLPGQAWAGFKVCNHATENISVAIGYYDHDYGWMSEGWWNILRGDCAELLSGDLHKGYYYIYAAGDGGDLWAGHKGDQDGGYFCISKHKFTYRNSDYIRNNVIDCEARNEKTKQFKQVDTQNAANFIYNLDD